jgi:hypothetical protein
MSIERALALLMLMAVIGVTTVFGRQRTDEQSIRVTRARSNAAIAAHDPSAIALAWMEDVHVTPSTSAQTEGRAANRDRIAEQFKRRPDTEYVRTPVTIDVYAPWAVASESAWLIQSELYVPTHCKGSSYCNRHP